MKLILKIIVFIIFVLSLQFILFKPTPNSSIFQTDKTDAILKEKPDVILLGDSVVRVADEKDDDKRPIDMMVQEKIPNLNVKAIHNLAYNSDVYLDYIKYITKDNYKPKLVIILINLRSFSPDWDQKPGYQFEREKLTLRYKNTPLFPYLKFLINVNVFNLVPITQTQYENTPVYSGSELIGTIKDFENDEYATFTESNQKNRILLYYTYPLSANHRKLKTLEEIAGLLKKNNIKAIFYITPIDYETIGKYTGFYTKDRITQNINLIKNSLSKYPLVFLDLSFKLQAKEFGWKDSIYINEHLNQYGRQFVAQELAASVIDLLKKNK